MSKYKYKALDESQKLICGEIESENKSMVLDKLKKDYKLTIIEIEELKKPFLFREKTNTKLNLSEIYYITEQIKNMLDAGIRIGEAIEIVLKTNKTKKINPILLNITSLMKKGYSLSQASDTDGNLFNKTYINILRAGEESGSLGESFDRILSNLKNRIELRSFLITSLTYPLILLITSLVSFIIMFTMVIPRFATIYDRYGKNIPEVTKFILEFSKIIKNNKITIFVLLLSFIALIIYTIYSKKYSIKIKNTILKIPIIKNLFIELFIIRFFNTLGYLIKSGVPVIKAMELVKNIFENEIIIKEIDMIINQLKKGEMLSAIISKSSIFPATTYYMVITGEKTGKLSEVMIETARNFEENFKRRLSVIVKLIEPAIIIIMGIVIGVLMYSVIIPIVNISSVIK